VIISVERDTFEILPRVRWGVPALLRFPREFSRESQRRGSTQAKRGWAGRIRYPGEDIWRCFNNWSRHWRRCGHHSPTLLSRVRRARRSAYQIFRDYKLHAPHDVHTLRVHCPLSSFLRFSNAHMRVAPAGRRSEMPATIIPIRATRRRYVLVPQWLGEVTIELLEFKIYDRLVSSFSFRKY